MAERASTKVIRARATPSPTSPCSTIEEVLRLEPPSGRARRAPDVTHFEIDADACTGNGRCYTLAPELVVDDDAGYGRTNGDGTITDDQLDLARRIVAACPEQAVHLVEHHG